MYDFDRAVEIVIGGIDKTTLAQLKKDGELGNYIAGQILQGWVFTGKSRKDYLREKAEILGIVEKY